MGRYQKLEKKEKTRLKGIIFLLVNVIVLLAFMLVLYVREIGYLESKVDYFDRLAEDYRVMLHPKMPYQEFPWYTLYDKDGKRPPHLFPDFAMNEMDGEFKDIKR